MPYTKTNLLVAEGETNQSDQLELGDYKIGYFLSKNLEKSTNNEDALFVFAEGETLVFGVTDGAGGHPRGKDAARVSAESVLNDFSKQKNLNYVDIIENANDAVISLKAGAHCTLAMCSIGQGSFRSFSVGDSEILYLNSNGDALYSNVPHSTVGYKVESGVIDQESSLDDPDRNIVTNMLGDKSVRIEVSTKHELKRGHTILVGTDGVFDNISHESLMQLVGQGSFDDAFNELKKTCEERKLEDWKKDDDIGFLLLRKVQS